MQEYQNGVQEAERTRSESWRQKQLEDRAEHRKSYGSLSWGQKRELETLRTSVEKIFGDWENQGELLLNRDLYERKSQKRELEIKKNQKRENEQKKELETKKEETGDRKTYGTVEELYEN